MVRIGPLSQDETRLLERIRRQAVGRVSQRAHMVLLRSRGYTAVQIAEIFGTDEATVRRWLGRYQARGALGLDDQPRPGRPPTDRLARHIIDAQASQPPWVHGLVQNAWTVGLLTAFLATRFHLILSQASVRRYLHRAGWRWARPRLAPATHAPSGQRKVDPDTPAKLSHLAPALSDRAPVLFLDECELQLLPVVRAQWMKGPRRRIPTPGQNAKRALFGALDARTGRVDHLVRAHKRAEDFLAFLDHLAQVYPTGPVVRALDNVVTHDARSVRAWLAQPEHQRFTRVWLPKYAAHEHNPIERVWGLVKDAVVANRLHGSVDALVDEAEQFLATRAFRAPYPAPPTPGTLPRAA